MSMNDWRKFDMRQHFHNSNLIEGFDGELYDSQMGIAWRYLLDQDRLDSRIIKKVHAIVVDKQSGHAKLKPAQIGHFRGEPGNEVNVKVGGYKAPDYSQVRRLMTNWVKTHNQTDPVSSHIRFEQIHPFVDGNGRVGRLLMWWQQVREGDEPMLISYATRYTDYYEWFRRGI